LNFNLDNIYKKHSINYHSIFEILKSKIVSNTDEAIIEYDLRSEAVILTHNNYMDFLVNIEDLFLTYTPKILRFEETKKSNDSSNYIIFTLLILKSNYSIMIIKPELVCEKSHHVLKIRGIKKKFFENKNNLTIVKDEQISGNILINERLVEANDHTQSNGVTDLKEEDEFILIKVEFLKTIIN